ncbi:helix-turn-helix transcriptional regulator [Leptospira sp. GIMC2001]|uniref:helix-turn-helix transcriptional regulator n=1 Tax=Leptospira sp. GIMC2001 TaxID=1513297 RepID=UPI00234BBEFB|nr:helix-turn-helix transcriptional regulator [Leptospira sp. GIMC2001]WCL49040.1 helix-turn-helix transcriptional regulator [Leptospira sp. GIMC2001]
MIPTRSKYALIGKTYIKSQDSGFHKHNLNQILLVKKGLIVLEDDCSKKPLHGNLSAFIPKSILHRVISLGDDVEFASIYISDSKNLNANISNIKIFNSSNLFRELILESSRIKKDKDIKTKMIDLATELIEVEVEKNSMPGLELPLTKDSKVKPFIDHIEKKYQEKTVLSSLTGTLPYSSRQIHRLFTQALKISPSQYLKIKRIQTACILLATTDRSIVEISEDCGYESISSFYSNFEELVGVPPKKFRLIQG